MFWFYLSFVDERRPKGEQFLGGCFVLVNEDDYLRTLTEWEKTWAAGDAPRDPADASEDEVWQVTAVAKAHRLGINPGGEALIVEAPFEALEATIPEGDRHRLLTRAEIEALG